MKVCVTGTNGFLASNLICQLLDEGYEVHGLIRTLSTLRVPGHQRFRLFIGELTDGPSLERAMNDCTYVIHTAALTDQGLPRYEDYRQVNVQGTQQVIAAAIKCKVKRLVYVSTANTIGYGIINTGQENIPITTPFNRSYYALSKLEAEKHVRAAKDQVETVIVNPTFMIGAYDQKPPRKNIVQAGLSRLVLCAPGGKNFIHVKDVARGTIAALQKGLNGENYLLAGENLTYAEFFNRMHCITRSKPILILLPKPLLLMAGMVGTLLRCAGVRTSFSITNMRILCTKNYYQNCKARKQLGLTFLPVEYAIKDALSYLRSTSRQQALDKQKEPGY